MIQFGFVTMMPQLTSNIVRHLVLWLLLTIVFCQALIFRNGTHPRHGVCGDMNQATQDSNILKLRYHHQGQVKLVVLRKILDSTLVSPLVPIWHIETNGDLSRKYKLYADSSAQPVFYHGRNSFSAVTYFPSTQTLHGVIDQEFFIEYLPLRDANNPDLVSAFIKPIPNEFAHSMNARHKRGTSEKRKSDTDVTQPPEKRAKGDGQKKKMYPEIFLIADVPPTRIDPTNQNKYERAMTYIVSYWNAVDMLFRTLKRVDISINIAGIIVVERENLEASGLVNAEEIHLNDQHAFISKRNSLETLGTYFYHADIVKRDSFDFLVWMTSASLVDNYVENEEYEDHENHEVIEKSKYTGAAVSADCGGIHHEERVNSKISNRAVVMYDEVYSQYRLAARGLANLMFVSNDDIEVVDDFHHSNCLPSNPMFESSGIMDPSNNRVEGYLQWSYCSEIHFERYSRSASSCCLLNYPSRTMGWPHHSYPVTPKTQCECYGMEAMDELSAKYGFCNIPLMCKQKGEDHIIGLPLDGTPCIQLRENCESFCNHNECI